MPETLTAPQTNPFSELVAEAERRYRELCCQAAEGIEIDPDAAIDLALAAGRSVHQMQQDVERVTLRYNAHCDRQAVDYDQQIEDAKKEIREANALLEAAKIANAEAYAALRAAYDRSSSATSLSARLQQERTKAAQAFSNAMKATAGDQRDYTDWRNFRLV